MRRSKIFSFLRGTSGGGGKGGTDAIDASGGTAPITATISRRSTKRYNRDPLTQIPSAPIVVPVAENGDGPRPWRFSQEPNSELYAISSSPSILDGRGLTQAEDAALTQMEKSQSWSGDRILDTDSGSSQGGTLSSSKGGSGSRSGTGGSGRSRERSFGPSRGGSRGGSRSGSRMGSDHGDSTPSSIYDQEIRYTTYTDADGYENVELPSPIRGVPVPVATTEVGHTPISRLSVKGSTRRSRRPSPRRSQVKGSGGESNEDVSGLHPHRGSVKGSVPTISLSASSPLPLRGARSPSTESNQSIGRGKRAVSRSPSRPMSRSPSQQFQQQQFQQSNRPPSRTSSRHSSRHSSRSPTGHAQYPAGGGPRSLSYEESVSVQQRQEPPAVPPPLWKTRSWQQYGTDSVTPQIERARLLARSRWQMQQQQKQLQQQQFQQQQQQQRQQQQQQQQLQLQLQLQQRQMQQSQQQLVNRVGQAMEDSEREKSYHYQRTGATHAPAVSKSRSWQQQSQESDPAHEALTRTYTGHERRQRRYGTSSARLLPSPSQGLQPPLGPSPSRSPVTSIIPPPHPSQVNQSIVVSDSPPQYQWQRQFQQQMLQEQEKQKQLQQQKLQIQYQQKKQQQQRQQQQQQQQLQQQQHQQLQQQQQQTPQSPIWEPQKPYHFQNANQRQAQQTQRPVIWHPQMNRGGKGSSTPLNSSGQTTPQYPSEYVELREYKAADRQQRFQERRSQSSSLKIKQPRPESYQGSHDQFIRSQFPQQVPLPQSQFRAAAQKIMSSKFATPPRDDEYASIADYVRDVRSGVGLPSSFYEQRLASPRARPTKTSSLMSSVELLHTLKRQLAISSPTYDGRSKSLEAGKAAAALGFDSLDSLDEPRQPLTSVLTTVETTSLTQQQEKNQQQNRSPPSHQQQQLDSQQMLLQSQQKKPTAADITPDFRALVAEKRARLKRSTGVFTGSGRPKECRRQATAPPTRCTSRTLFQFTLSFPIYFF